MFATRLDVRLDTSLETLMLGAPPDGAPRVLATLVATAGSTYRKPGARMLILADGTFYGLLSGGCLETDLNIHARNVLESGDARAVEYDMRGPDDILFGIGAGCEGAMRVLLEAAGPGSPAAAALAAAARATGAWRPTCLVAVHESSEIALGTYDSADLSGPLLAASECALAERRSQQLDLNTPSGPLRALVQYLAPPPHLLICGAGPDAQPVVAAALSLGWRVSVVDHRPAYALAHRFPGAHVSCAPARELNALISLGSCHAAVVMSHHLQSDVTYLRALSEGRTPGYIGLLGPAVRRQRIAEELGSTADRLHARIRGPVGMDIGAVTPDGIALSIVAQIHAWLAGRLADPMTVNTAALVSESADDT
jgi:xanthine/CO dehydrogenase XdhC/CoxF family maturation factor